MAKETKDTKDTEELKEQNKEEAPDTKAEKADAENPQEAAEQAEKPEEAAAEEAADAASAPAEDDKKIGVFRKKEKKDKKDEKIEELTDKIQRQMAEFDNFRKRTEREKSTMYDMGARDVIEKVLPIVDNFERGLAAADAADPFVDGMNKVYKQMMTALTDLGVTPIEAAGQPFDPNFHNAVMHVDDPEAGENVVVEELQKGYMYKDTVLRYSMVKVAN